MGDNQNSDPSLGDLLADSVLDLPGHCPLHPSSVAAVPSAHACLRPPGQLLTVLVRSRAPQLLGNLLSDFLLGSDAMFVVFPSCLQQGSYVFMRPECLLNTDGLSGEFLEISG